VQACREIMLLLSAYSPRAIEEVLDANLIQGIKTVGKRSLGRQPVEGFRIKQYTEQLELAKCLMDCGRIFLIVGKAIDIIYGC